MYTHEELRHLKVRWVLARNRGEVGVLTGDQLKALVDGGYLKKEELTTKELEMMVIPSMQNNAEVSVEEKKSFVRALVDLMFEDFRRMARGRMREEDWQDLTKDQQHEAAERVVREKTGQNIEQLLNHYFQLYGLAE